MLRTALLFSLLALGCSAEDAAAQPERPPEKERVFVVSSLDGTRQPSYVWTPAIPKGEKRPLLVRLHSWSYGYEQENAAWFAEAVDREWIYLHPNFRGRNDNPQACGSKLARQDVLDAIDWAIENHAVDTERIYVCGVSGGGHMTMLMSGHHPERFSAASAWVGISNLADWYRFHAKDGEVGRYAKMIAACTGGAPGDSDAVDAEYHDRSPIHHLHRVGELPLEINAGVKDGRTGSVPIHHSLRAFNVIARTRKATPVTEAEMEQLWTKDRLDDPGDGEDVVDPLYERAIRLRRSAGASRVTIFDGGHEGIARAACEWMSKHRRATRSPIADEK